MKTETLFSSVNMEWETPPELFAELDKEFHFTLDVAATAENALCERYYTKETDGLSQSWQTDGVVWCNPPYGRSVAKWVRKAYLESMGGADNCHADSGASGYGVVSRLGIPQGGVAVHSGAASLRAERDPGEKLLGISVNDSDLQREGCMMDIAIGAMLLVVVLVAIYALLVIASDDDDQNGRG
jgi:hypothetical protein